MTCSEMTSPSPNDSVPTKMTWSTMFYYSQGPFHAGYTLSAVSAVVLLVNMFLFCVFMMHKNIRKPVNYPVISLTVNDSLYSIIIILATLLFTFIPKTRIGVVCIILRNGFTLTGATAALNHVALTYERYVSIKDPLQHRARASCKRIVLSLSLPIIVSVAINCSLFIPLPGRFVDVHVCGIFWAYYSPFFYILYGSITGVLCIVIICVLFVKIIRIIQESAKRFGRTVFISSSKGRESHNQIISMKKSLNMLVLMCTIFFFMWLPLLVAFVILASCTECRRSTWFYPTITGAVILYSISKIITPIIYVVKCNQILKAVCVTLHIPIQRSQNQPDKSTVEMY